MDREALIFLHIPKTAGTLIGNRGILNSSNESARD